MGELLKDIIGQIAELKNTEKSLADERNKLLIEIENVKDETERIGQTIAELQPDIKKGQGLIKNTIGGKQTQLQQLSEKAVQLSSDINKIHKQISDANNRICTNNKKLEEILADMNMLPLPNIDFKDGYGIRNLSINQFHALTENVMRAVNANDFSGNGKHFYEMGMLIAKGALTPLFLTSLKCLLYGIYAEVCKNIPDNPEAKKFIQSYQAYEKSPSPKSLSDVTNSAINNLKQLLLPIKSISGQSVNFCFCDSLVKILPEIIRISCPEYDLLNKIFRTCNHKCGQWKNSAFQDGATQEYVYSFLQQLSLWILFSSERPSSKHQTLYEYYLVVSAYDGYKPAIEELTRNYYSDAILEDGRIMPLLRGDADPQYPFVFCGLGWKKEGFGCDVLIPYPINFLTTDVSDYNHYLSVVYDDENKYSREVGAYVVQSLAASIMAWAGPQKFTLDVIDFEHTGIGAYPLQFLGGKLVKIISRQEDWTTELDALERLIEKRSQLMRSIFEYNSVKPDNFEPFKIVIVQDYNGLLINAQTSVDNYTDLREKERYEVQKRNVHRFTHLLERGYKYGLLFIVVSSNDIYRTSLPILDFQNVDPNGSVYNCSKFPNNPYSSFRVEGIDADEPDWLMKWLSGGEEIKSRRAAVNAGSTQDGANGVLVTDLTEDGTDVEFRFDTVSHTHAFIIGKTGSGKSVLLHNIITGLINRYSTDDLELYMLDLKMGGVEFNRYRRLPHLRFLLVDNSDIQIVLEIMRDIDAKMRERGKAFRDAAVSNIKEYNAAHPDRKMSQVIVVIDECHQIFSMGGGRGAAKEQREITERLAKIAKEGRSQGIHLIFATQTLSGSEIPPDIQKNITDYYLLKCAPSDSESLVRGSSNKTESLPVGKVYYYHADRQALFQGIYNDNQALEDLISESINRFGSGKSHGQYYFNGAQTFRLDKNTIDSFINGRRRGIAGSPGRMINLQQQPVSLTLSRDYSENILLTGINVEEQLSRTTLALMSSQIAAAYAEGRPLKVNVIDCLDRDSEISGILSDMSEEGFIFLYRPAESENLLEKLCQDVSGKSLPCDTLLYIFGQERFAEMKRDQKFSKEKAADSDNPMDLFQGLSFSTPAAGNDAMFDSYRKAIIYLLENGPLAGLSTVIQIDKADKLLFEDFISAKMVSSRFKHIIVLRTEPRAAMSLGISDEIKVEDISCDIDRLRAFYYFDENGSYTLFSPYEIVSTNLLKDLTQK